jgi:tRNA pseudouridine55 synthase
MERKTSGILVVDKPPHMSSARVVASLKKICGASKAGHTGTLDPFATGVLICCLNQATRLARFFLHGRKTYAAVLRLGIETDTQDSTGTVTGTCKDTSYPEERIRSLLKQLEGPVDQRPPVYSALKHKGIPLYKLARSGKPVQKPARRVFVYSVDHIAVRQPEVKFEISCSAGTYIRTLCADIGSALGCGGHLKALRRIESSGFTVEEAATLPEIKNLEMSGRLSQRIVSMADALKGMPAYTADKALTEKIRRGADFNENCFSSVPTAGPEEYLKIIDKEKKLVAVLERIEPGGRFRYCCVFGG